MHLPDSGTGIFLVCLPQTLRFAQSDDDVSDVSFEEEAYAAAHARNAARVKRVLLQELGMSVEEVGTSI